VSIRVLLADDQALVRAGFRALLERADDIEVVGEAADGEQAVARTAELRPDLVLMDVRMPDLDGLAATRAIKQAFPEVCVVIVTMYENADYMFEALKAGAAGYVLKDATQAQLVGAIRQVLRGDALLNSELATQVLYRLAGGATPQSTPPAQRLTPREYEVLRLLAQGQTNREIARNLGITAGTAKVYVERIIAKLGVSDRTQAAVRAIGLGLLAPPRE
jgi:DNA-binding NarL/FixJ family response regulator